MKTFWSRTIKSTKLCTFNEQQASIRGCNSEGMKVKCCTASFHRLKLVCRKRSADSEGVRLGSFRLNYPSEICAVCGCEQSFLERWKESCFCCDPAPCRETEINNLQTHSYLSLFPFLLCLPVQPPHPTRTRSGGFL